MSGKHRETRRHIVPGAALASAYVLGSVAAITAALAPTASADPNWDAIAQCESGGNWATNTGNGFHGGLQFTPSTWRAYGGTGAAENSSRDVQIAVARKVLAAQGIKAWPVCGKRGGDTSVTASIAAPRHAAPSVPAIPLAASQTAPKHAAPVITPDTADYVVTEGDTLAGIAAAAHTDGGWQTLAEANKDSVADPNLIAVGQHLHLRPTPGPVAGIAPASVTIDAPEPSTVGPMMSDTGDVLGDNGVTARPGLVRAQ